MTSNTVHRNPWFRVTETVDENGRSWFRVRRPDSVIVAVFAGDKLLFVTGRRDTTGPEALYEFPSGAMDATDADILAAAARELHEETGCTAQSLTVVGYFFDSPGVSDSKTYVLTGELHERGEPHLEPGEEWVVVDLSTHEVNALICSGLIRDGATLAALAVLHTPSSQAVST